MSPSVQLSLFSSDDLHDDSSVKREFKGSSVIAALDDYVAVDIETSGFSPNYDLIIELAAVRVKNGVIVDQFSSLCNTCEIDDETTKRTGITNAMLRNAPQIDDVLPKFIDFIGDLPLVGHNIVQFDSNFMYDACVNTLNVPLRNNMVDTLRICRLSLKHLPDRNLATVLHYFGIENRQAHRALSDAICTHLLYERLKPFIVGDQAFPESCAFGGYTYDQVYKSVRKMVGNPGDTVSMTINQNFATVYMFNTKAFSIVLNAKAPYLESDKSIAFEHVANIPGARQLKNTARFPIASKIDAVPAIEALVQALYNYFSNRQTSFSMMGCCNDFVRCSDAKECLHKDNADYSGCRYRRNLEAGRIYYGKNANAGALAKIPPADDSTL